MKVYLNGRMVKADTARLSVADAGFTHGVGLFETMAAANGKVFRLQQHLDRLADSAAALGLAAKLDTRKLAKAVQRTVKENNLDAARVRLTVTPGSLSMLRGGESKAPKQTHLVVAEPPVQYDPAYFEKGITALVAPPGANPFDPAAGHKTLAYWMRLRTLRQAAAAGAGEAIWLNVSNHLASGAVSNIFLVKDETLLTPIARGEEVKGALPAPVLPGVTRAAVIELAGGMDIPVETRMLDVNDLLEADEVFLTNSSWQLLPVTKIEKKAIGDGKVGEVSVRLREALLALIENETTA